MNEIFNILGRHFLTFNLRFLNIPLPKPPGVKKWSYTSGSPWFESRPCRELMSDLIQVVYSQPQTQNGDNNSDLTLQNCFKDGNLYKAF